jgi:hypothetical protein
VNTTTVRVTAKHIADGKPGDACTCALALAIGDALREQGTDAARIEVSDPSTGEWTAEVEQHDEAGMRVFSAHLDDDAAGWVQAFDANELVEPFETELTWTDALLDDEEAAS